MMLRAIGGLLLILLVLGPEVFAQPQIRPAGAKLIAETRTNGVIEANERVTLSLGLRNVGGQTASNLLATIQSGNGVFDPDPEMRDYGLLAPGAQSVSREFTFTATAPSNTLFEVKLELSDAGRDLGVVTFRFRIGPSTLSVTNANQIDINDFGGATPYPSTIVVSNLAGRLIRVSVTLSNLNHAFPDDVDILLVGPAGDTVMLMSDACGDNLLQNKTITFTDEADQVIPDSTFPILSFYRPANYEVPDPFVLPAPLGPYATVMSAFNGKSAIGEWKLYVMDDWAPDAGTIARGWALHLTALHRMDDTPVLTLLRRTANRIRFEVRGEPGHTYSIETSPDPLQFAPFETFLMPPSGAHVFEYPFGAENQFFRAVSEP